jgi:ABC-type uncharacterized transport system permease subunit
MGLLRGTMTLGAILGAGFVWLTFDKTNPQYRMGFLCAGAVAAVAGIIYGLMHTPDLHQPRAKLVVPEKLIWAYG